MLKPFTTPDSAPVYFGYVGLWHFREEQKSVPFLYTGALSGSFPVNLLKPTGYVMHQQFNIQQFYALPTLYLCVLYLSKNKQRLVPLTP